MVNPIGGLASGIDTMGLLEGIMKAESAPLESLRDKKSLLEIKKDIFVDVNDQLTALNRILLELKLETTFKSKDLTSSDDTVVSGIATTEAYVGSHTINISQLATSATARSMYTNSVLVSNPSNTSGLSYVVGRPVENIEGRYEITISDEGSYYKAVAVFTPNTGGTLKTLTGSVSSIESATVEGAIANSISSADTLQLSVGSDNITVSLDDTTADVTMMSLVAVDLEDKINAALNTARDTTDVTYAAVRATGNTGGTGDDGFVIYSTSNETITVTGGTGTVQADLGYSSGTQGTSQTISNTVWADNLSALLGKMNDIDRGLIRGVTFTESSATGLTTGSAEVDVSAELNVVGGTPTYVYGGLDVAAGASLNTTATGINNAGFATTITGVYNSATGITSGSFTINGIEITIGNYASATVNDIIGLINGSAAGVTASYDSTTDSFTLMSNADGSISVSLGDAGDTSNFLEAAKLTFVTGASIDYGNYKGTLDSNTTLSSAGFSRTPTSGTFTVNGTVLYVDVSSDTLETLISKINNSNAGVTAGYDSTTDKFTLSTDQDEVDTNTNKITVGATTDTSNILNMLNLQDDFYTTMTGTATSGNRAADSILIAPPTGMGFSLSIPATTGSGAYQSNAGTVNWIDGIKDGGTITVLAGAAGATEYTWTNNSGDVISDIDTFVTEWNKTSNWSGGDVEVRVIKESESELRFFSRSQGAGAEFTLKAHSAYDLYELGVVTTPPTELSATDNSPEAVWHFDEGSGLAAADATSNSNDGTISGATWVEGDFFSRSLDFDGTDDYVEVTGSASLNLNNATNFTIEAWINPDTYGGGLARILSKTGVEIFLDSATEAVFVTIDGNVASDTVESDIGSLPTTFSDKWYHIAVTYDDGQAVGSKTKIYIDGQDVTKAGSDAVNGFVVDDTADLYIGNDTAGGGGNPFDGQIDEIGFYEGTTKTLVQIQADALITSREVTVSTGDQATASAQYNAMNFAYAMNNSASAGIWATTDSSGGLTLTSETLGYYGYFGISDDTGTTVDDFFGTVTLNSSYSSDIAIGTAGEDAYFSVDNVNYIRTSNTIDDVIGGVEFTLRNVSATNTILNIEVDTDKGIEKLTDFIISYNKTLEMINPPQLTTFQKGYLEPLTDEEEAALTANEIAMYEELHTMFNGYKFIQGESSFKRLYEYFRLNTTGNITGLVDGFNSLTDINIIPGLMGTDDDARKGYLIAAPTSDEDDYSDYIKSALESNYALMDAIANNSDEVYLLFANDSSTSSGSDGIARVLTDKIDSYINTGGMLKRQIKSYGAIDKDIALLDDQIFRWEDRLEMREEYYWRKFMAMENAINKLSVQSERLTSMLLQLSDNR